MKIQTNVLWIKAFLVQIQFFSQEWLDNPFRPEFTIVIFIHYKPGIILDL